VTSGQAILAAKLLSLITQPLAWVALLLLGAVLLWQRQKLARRLVIAALCMLVLIGWQPLPDMLLRHLESQYTEIPPGADMGRFAGVVVLGGALEPAFQTSRHSQPVLNDGAERMTAVLPLLMRNPQLTVVFTGGEGQLIESGSTEAKRAQIFFDSQGIAAGKVLYESASRNTYENAVLTAQLPSMDIAKPWLLLTSAWHMPRSMATFAKAGWHVTAYPVDFRTGDSTPWYEYSLMRGTERWQLALHELLGLWMYRLAGRA
jgi:uncharacterized SAM-binding protein YcdF (DUF218 family)